MAGPHSWLGNDSGNEGTWNIAANWLLGLIPNTGEDLKFDANAANDILTSPVAGKNEFGTIIISSDFAYEFGSDSVTIALDASVATEELIIDASSVPTYFKISGKFTRITVLNAKKTSTACVLSGTITSLRITKGQVTAVTGSNITTIYVSYATSPSTDSVLTLPSGCTLTDIYQQGGTVACSSPVAGKLDLDVGAFTHSDGDMELLNSRGGTYNWEAANHIITKANLFAGTFDASGDPSPKSIIHMDIWSKATAYLNNGMQNIKLINPAAFYGGKLVFDKGSFFQINQTPTTSSPSVSPSASPSSTPSVSPSSTPSVSPSVSPSASPSASPSSTPSVSPSVSPSMSPAPSASPSFSVSPSSTPSASPSPSISPSSTPSVSPSVSPSSTPSVSPSSTPSVSPSVSPSSTPSVSPSMSPAPSSSPSAS